MLVLTLAPSGNGMILRDTNTRQQVLIAEHELITIGSALINAATVARPQRRPQR